MNLAMTIREQQDEVAKTIPGAYMVNIMDSGARLQRHPRNKRPVGERLALLALGKVYGEDIFCEAPKRLMRSWRMETWRSHLHMPGRT
jgi:hypothetical protein